jgi:hypothetical protein
MGLSAFSRLVPTCRLSTEGKKGIRVNSCSIIPYLAMTYVTALRLPLLVRTLARRVFNSEEHTFRPKLGRTSNGILRLPCRTLCPTVGVRFALRQTHDRRAVSVGNNAFVSICTASSRGLSRGVVLLAGGRPYALHSSALRWPYAMTLRLAVGS